jgi:hypothetical protein
MISDNEECAKASPLPGKKLFGNENNKFKVCVNTYIYVNYHHYCFSIQAGLHFLDDPLKRLSPDKQIQHIQ